MILAFTGLLMLQNKLLHMYRFTEGNVICKEDVLSIDTCLVCLWICFGLNTLIYRCCTKNIHPSFVGWTGGAQLPTIFVVRRPATRQLTAGESAWGDTPLHDAVTSGKVQIVELLLSKGAAVDAKNEDGPGPPAGSRGRMSRQLESAQMILALLAGLFCR